MTRAQSVILKALKGDARLWSYSTQKTGWLVTHARNRRVRRSTIEAMIEADLLVIGDVVWRAHGSDIHYRLPQSAQTGVK